MQTINTAEDAVNVAERFVAKYYSFRTLKRVAQVGEKWLVEFDVGILSTSIIRVTLDGKTGNVVEYGEAK